MDRRTGRHGASGARRPGLAPRRLSSGPAHAKVGEVHLDVRVTSRTWRRGEPPGALLAERAQLGAGAGRAGLATVRPGVSSGTIRGGLTQKQLCRSQSGLVFQAISSRSPNPSVVTKPSRLTRLLLQELVGGHGGASRRPWPPRGPTSSSARSLLILAYVPFGWAAGVEGSWLPPARRLVPAEGDDCR